MPLGAAYLVKASSAPPLSSSPASFLGENLDLLVQQRWRQWCHFFLGGFAVSAAGFGAIGCLPYAPCSGVTEVSTVNQPFDPAFASSSSPSLLVAQVASVWRMLCRLAGRSLFRWMICHLYFVRMDALPSGFELVVPFGGCFATSLGLGGCFDAVVLLHLGRCFAAGDLSAATEAMQP